ncbi:hypothetical protein NIASO_00335 [Niabella soli DSM 19437]|uniref:Uncharacterized protein n=1 Tax=Niabella soli DSM 19437 TaxID=929713 RepID=W0F1Y3_9BACT|nr:hypothetical protein NIASO_00335 [Niabella soli DSM 19437]
MLGLFATETQKNSAFQCLYGFLLESADHGEFAGLPPSRFTGLKVL